VNVATFAFFRNSLMVITIFAVLKIRGISFSSGISREHVPLFVGRCIFNAIVFYTFISTYKYLPLAIGNTMIQTKSLITPILAQCALGEPATFIDYFTIVIQFIGVVVIAKAKQDG